MKKWPSLLFLTIIFFVFHGCLGTTARIDLSKIGLSPNIVKENYTQSVKNRTKINGIYANWVKNETLAYLYGEKDNPRTQYVVVVDKAPDKQNIFICLYDAETESIDIIAVNKVSTGDAGRKGFYSTPLGLFVNDFSAIGYRSEGKKNQDNFQWLGPAGLRVWDFGWVYSDYFNQEKQIWEQRQMRLTIHSTDPNWGEPRLGKPNSMGCIRVSAEFNNFMDKYGFLDRTYLERPDLKKISWLLREDREPAMYAGKYLIIIESKK